MEKKGFAESNQIISIHLPADNSMRCLLSRLRRETNSEPFRLGYTNSEGRTIASAEIFKIIRKNIEYVCNPVLRLVVRVRNSVSHDPLRFPLIRQQFFFSFVCGAKSIYIHTGKMLCHAFCAYNVYQHSTGTHCARTFTMPKPMLPLC